MNNNKGFTLIEVMIAMVILGMTLMAVTSMQIMTIKGNTTGNVVSSANMKAREMLEQCVMNAWDLETGMFEEKDGIYDLTWKIEDHTSRSKRVTVWVSFKPGMSRKKTIKVSTLVGINHQTLNNGTMNAGTASSFKF